MGQIKTTPPNEDAVLGIYPHPKAVGFAVMNSPTSIEASGRRFINAKYETLAYLKFITALIKLYKPKYVILEDEESRNKHRLTQMKDMFRQIEITIVQMNHSLIHYSRADIRRRFDDRNKPEIAEKISRIFPSYIDRLPKERVSTDGAESPTMSEFDALSLCLTHLG